jgi:hypothetical protein
MNKINNKKKIITIYPSKKQSILMYKASMKIWPEFSRLEYQASKQELKVLKKLITSAWVLYAMERWVEEHKSILNKIKKGLKDSAEGRVKSRGSFKKYIIQR